MKHDLATEFFYEGIERVPVGLLIIILYWRTETENIFRTHGNFFSSPLIFIACVLAIAWLVGLMVDAITFHPFRLLLEWLARYCELIAGGRSWLLAKRELNEPANGKDSDWDREKRRQAYFASGLRIMSRCLFVIFFFAFLFDQVCPPEPFSNIHWNRYYSLVCFFVFLVLWVSLSVKDWKPEKAPTNLKMRAS